MLLSWLCLLIGNLIKSDVTFCDRILIPGILRCATPPPPITTELFGDDIGKEIDEVTKTSRLGLKLSTPRKERPRFHSYMVHLFVVLKADQRSNKVTTEPKITELPVYNLFSANEIPIVANQEGGPAAHKHREDHNNE